MGAVSSYPTDTADATDFLLGSNAAGDVKRFAMSEVRPTRTLYALTNIHNNTTITPTTIGSGSADVDWVHNLIAGKSYRFRVVGTYQSVALTTGEFSVLKVFARHARQPLSREKLMELARGREYEVFDRSLDVQISRLRKLIEPDPSSPLYIQTVWGLGYVFIPEGQPR